MHEHGPFCTNSAQVHCAIAFRPRAIKGEGGNHASRDPASRERGLKFVRSYERDRPHVAECFATTRNTFSMSSTTNFPHPAIACAESIALLYLLHSVPTPPSSNRLDHLPRHREGYALSFTRERSLVGLLAFLSNTKDDRDHIPAVCIREDLEPSSLSILLAVNSGKPGDGNVVLQELKRGFERIYTVLSQVSDGE